MWIRADRAALIGVRDGRRMVSSLGLLVLFVSSAVLGLVVFSAALSVTVRGGADFQIRPRCSSAFSPSSHLRRSIRPWM